MTLKNIWRAVLNFILPARCVGCRAPNNYICANCLANLPPAVDQSDNQVISLFDYNDTRVKKLIWRLKYHGHSALAEELGALLHESLISLIADWYSYHPGNTKPWVVIPIPLSPLRLKQRGYNQAEKLAKNLVATHDEVYELALHNLIKIRETVTQVSLRDRAHRLKNLRGAYQITKPEKICDREIILVDDVTTTGATIAEARRVLKTAGAHTVLAITLAHG